jgi:hypothetical protein
VLCVKKAEKKPSSTCSLDVIPQLHAGIVETPLKFEGSSRDLKFSFEGSSKAYWS